MICAADVVLVRAARGVPPTVTDLATVPSSQWDIFWDDLRRVCPAALAVVPGKQRNALRVELLPSTEPRCLHRSPDGRGSAWMASGGSPLAYGLCEKRHCPKRAPSPRPDGDGE